MFHRNLKTKQMDKREEFEDDPDGSIEKSGSRHTLNYIGIFGKKKKKGL